MKCQELEKHLLDFVYDELEADARAGVEDHLAGCGRCRAAVADLGITRRFLGAWGESEADSLPPLAVRPPRPAAGRSRSLPGRIWVPAAAAALVLLVAGVFVAVVPVSLQYDSRGLVFRLGGPSSDGIAQVSDPVLRKVDRMIADSEQRQAQRTLDIVQNVYYRLEDDRAKDRQSIQQGFDLIKEIYMDQIEKNNQLLEMSVRQADYRVPAGAK
jgi:hypothetical protein